MDQQTRQTFVTLIQTQLWPRDSILAYQMQLLERLCRHARAHVPFYRDSGRLAPLFGKDDDFDYYSWKGVPVLTRDEAWRNRDALRAETVPPVMEPLVLGSTTGSTGTPLPFYRTALSRTMAEAQLARALAWRQLGVLNPIAISKAVSGDAAGHEYQAGQFIPLTDGAVTYVDFFLPPKGQAAHLRQIAPRLIMTYPSVALSWIEAGYDFAGVHAVVLTGEACTSETRARIVAVFPGHVVELYSASEAGPIAVEGPTSRDGEPVLNVCEENVFLEIPAMGFSQQRPQPIVITPFYSYGTPLIRYAPGDYAIFARAPAKETPGLRRVDRIVGRARNLFRRRDGTSFWPSLSSAKMMAIAPHTHRQLIQEDYDRFVMRMVFDAPPSPGQLAQIRDHVADVTGGGDILIEPMAAIDDGRTQGKAYENFICRIP